MKTILHLAIATLGFAALGLGQPVITQQPQNQTNVLGGSVTFTVAATGTALLNYQWRYYLTASSFTNLPGATEPSLTLTNIQPVAGRFAVAVWDANGTNRSQLVALTVLLPATILTQPTNLTLFSASHATFSAVVTGAAPVRLQWFFNQTPLPGKTNPSLTVFNVQPTNQGAYSLVASNFLRAVTGEVATLTLINPTNGQNIKLGDKPPGLPANQRAQAEPHITRSFSDPNLLVATFQEGRFTDGGALGCGYAVSHDGGVTWSRGLIPGLTALSGGPYERATDPVAAIDYAGNIFLGTYSFISGGREAMTISKSTNGGVSFSAPVLAVTNDSVNYFLDKNWLAVNTFPGTPTFGRLVVSWTSLFFTNGAVETQSTRSNGVVLSDDGGLTWSRLRFVGPRRGQSTQPMFLPDGSLAMVHWNFDGPRIEMEVSEDGGLTFGESRVVAEVHPYTESVARGLESMPSATCDRMAGVIHVAWQGRLDAATNSRPCILFSKSIDKGQTWTTPVAVNDTPDGRSVFTPGITASADGQHLTVIFYDKRHDSGQGFFVDLYLAESFDGGETWQPNTRLSDTSTDLRTAPLTSRGYMLGDYQAVAPALDFNTPAVACWIDGRSGSPDPYVIRFDRRRGTTFETWQKLRFSTNELADPAISGPEADPDGDGIANLAEYAHGLEPRHPDAAPLRFGSDPLAPCGCDSKQHFRFWWDALSVLDDVAFSSVESSDLVHWTPSIPFVAQPRETSNRIFRTFEAAPLFNPAEAVRVFRLKVEQTNAPAR